MPEMKYCDHCKYLDPKERDQSGEKEPHMCVLYGMPVFHNGQHPRIPTPDYCNIDEDEEDAVTEQDYQSQNPQEVPRE